MQTGQVMVFFALLSYVMGIVYLIYFGTGSRKNRYLPGFFLAKVVQGTGILFLGLKEEVAFFQNPWLSSILMTLGLSMEVFIFISYDQVFRKKQFRIILGFCLAGILAVLANKSSSDAIIIICFNSALGCVYLSGAWFLWKRENLSRFARVSMISFLVFGLAWLFAVYYALVYPLGLDMLNTTNISHAILSIASLFNFVIVSLGYVMLLKELDEQKIKEDAEVIQNDNTQLKELNSTKDQFFSIIAHDLRGPIGGLAQLGEMLSGKDSQLNEIEREHLLQLVANTSKNSFILLENLLLWARSESGGLQLKKEEIHLHGLMSSTIELFDAVIEQKKAKVTNSLPVGLTVSADIAMLSTVFRNLFSNALKFIQVGGFIEILAEFREPEKVICLHFKDDGIGIPDNKAKDLLAIDSSFTRNGTLNETGSGLGLKLCNQFILRHGGSIRIESTLNEGSCFSVYLPV
ncbi:MAG: sensor histidine kinase [Bacteroidia bacterium]